MGVTLEFKVIIVGDIAVGKTCLMLQYNRNYFESIHCCTIGVDFSTHMLTVDDREVKLLLWDTSGQENFLAVCPSYYRGAAGALLVYDISRRDTFCNILRWYNDVGIHANDHVVILVIGNKSDLEKEREVTTEEGEKFAEDHGFFFLETSAKMNLNVKEAFQKIADEIYNLVVDSTYQVTDDEHGVAIHLSGSDHLLRPPPPGVPEKRHCCKWF